MAGANVTTTVERTARQWVGSHEAAKILGRGPKVVRKLAEAGHVRTHSLPGLRTHYFRPDLEALAPKIDVA